LLGVLGLSASLAGASQVRSLNLEQMTARAATVFAGRCVEVRTVSDPTGREITVATFEVHRAVKGSSPGAITIRMPGDDDGTGVAAPATWCGRS
jgi:hypothetical protein